MDDNYKDIEKELLFRKARMENERLLEMRYYEEKKQRQRRVTLVIISLLAPVFIITGKFFDFPESYKLLSYGFIGVATVLAFFMYLQPVSSRNREFFETSLPNDFKEEFNNLRHRNREIEKQNNDLRTRFEKIIKQIQSGSVTGELFGESDKAEILDKIQAKLESEALDDYQKSLVSVINEQLRSKGQEEVFTQISSRLEGEVQNLAKRGNVNLILGIFTTLTGLGILGYSVFEAPLMTNAIEIASHFVPRLSLVILIEVFAYFFLKLYKQSLSEIKYFQNEITNIESKYLGLRLSIESGNNEITEKVVDNLIKTERNFVLEKGQSTVEIERSKIEQQKSSELLKILDSVTSKLK
ncbi:hypothetical protein [Paraglaciecola sp. L1A13]|uniref:hypothetical protein n=1 Tax=Paraglaciecola sp. L1A13 TaxID=2686359 RepID=UPI00131CCBD7|nr:hypothetical protein [Paraglaciecola sp. L1A13]